MEKVKKIINSISWVIVALTGILLIVKWNDIPALVITHIGMGISYGSKNILPMLFCIELVVSLLSSKHSIVKLQCKLSVKCVTLLIQQKIAFDLSPQADRFL